MTSNRGRNVIILQNHVEEGPGLLTQFFATHNWHVRIMLPCDMLALMSDDMFDSSHDSIAITKLMSNLLSDIDAVVILGGPMGVDDIKSSSNVAAHLPFVVSVIRHCLTSLPDVGVFGICLGGRLFFRCSLY
jgi:hypothetical protein